MLRGIPTLREPRRLRPWLFGIARRAVMDRLRRRYSAPVPEAIDVDAIATPDEGEGLAAEIEAMRDELETMPVTEREVLVLFYLRELTLVEVGDVLAVPVGTVKSRLFRAREMLRRRLARKGVRP